METVSLIIDSNFFINGFKDNPVNINAFKEICDDRGYSLYTSLRVFQELDWRIRKELKYKINVVDITKEDIDKFIRDNQGKSDFLPQKPDLTLLILAERFEESILISSDLKLIETANEFHNNINGVMSSAFLLKLIEEEIDDAQKQLLIKIREKIYDEEIRYSIQRQQFYDPITRIKLIERQSFDVIRNIKIPEVYEEYQWSSPDVYPLITLVKEIKDHYPRYLKDIKEEKYEPIISELNNIRKEIYDTLLLLNWQIDRKEHEKLLKLINPNLVFLNYLTAVCYLYIGTKNNIYQAFRRLESASGILLIGFVPADLYRTLMISLHQLRIIVLLLLKKYDDAVMYFSIYERKCEEWGFEKIYNYSKGIYYALVNLQGHQIIEKISEKANIKSTLRFLLDISHQLFRLANFEEARLILNQAFALNLELKDEKFFEKILNQMLILFYAYDNTQLLLDIASFVEQIKKIYIHEDKSLEFINDFWDEIKNQKIPLIPDVTNKKIPSKALPKSFSDWMTIFKIVKERGKEKYVKLFCRNWNLQINLLIIFDRSRLLRDINLGDLIRFGEGFFKIEKTKKDIMRKYNCILQVIPDEENSKFFIRGSQGCKCLELEGDSMSYLNNITRQDSTKLTTKIKKKLRL